MAGRMLTRCTSLPTTIAIAVTVPVAACATAEIGSDAGRVVDSGTVSSDSGSASASVDANRPFLAADAHTQPPTPPDAPSCSNGSPANVLVNSHFEAGAGVGWMESSSGAFPLIYNVDDLPDEIEPLPSGTYAAWLGGADDVVEYIYQRFTVPDATADLTIRLWRWIDTVETTNEPADLLFVDLWDTDGQLLERVASPPLDNTDATSTWIQETFTAVGDYRGMEIELDIAAVTDFSFVRETPTVFFIDAVEVIATPLPCM